MASPQATPTAFAPAAPPTWTPTPTHTQTTKPDAHPVSLSTPLASPTPPRITTTPIADIITAVPSARTDAAGPQPIATIQPLAPGQGRNPVRLMIPVLGMDVPVSPMGWHIVTDASGSHSEWDVPDFAAGHHIDSAFPGEAGNVIFSGHHNLGARVFAPIATIGEPANPLRLGDQVIVVDEVGRHFTYRITGWKRFPESSTSLALRQENAGYLQQTEFPQITLITCWPPQSNTHRVVIFGVLTERSP